MGDVHVEEDCDYINTWHYKLGFTFTVGHLHSMSFKNAGIDLEHTIEVPDPENPESYLPVMGVFHWYRWSRKAADPSFFRIRLPAENLEVLERGFNDPKGGTEIGLAFRTYRYDHRTGQEKNYKRVDTEDQQLLWTWTENTELKVDPAPCPTIQQPKNWGVEFWLTPKGKQVITIATGVGAKSQVQIGSG
jgi:hypothetical protein